MDYGFNIYFRGEINKICYLISDLSNWVDDGVTRWNGMKDGMTMGHSKTTRLADWLKW
jgi:hypothetical protein